MKNKSKNKSSNKSNLNMKNIYKLFKEPKSVILLISLLVLVVVLITLVSEKGTAKNVNVGSDSIVEENTKDENSETVNEDCEESKADNSSDVTDNKKTEKSGKKKDEKNTDGRKKVYLTFDDGPSILTSDILDVLDSYGVKATFFTICNTRQRDVDNMKRIVEEGHTLGIHSVTHSYSQIYSSLDSFKDDVLGMQQYLYDTTGVKTYYYRFPGGSSNRTSSCNIDECKEFLDEAGFSYYDWNISSGDAKADGVPKDTIVNNVLSEIGDKDEYIVLMHDAAHKQTTLEALPEIIEGILDKGYEILPITEDTKPIHHGNK